MSEAVADDDDRIIPYAVGGRPAKQSVSRSGIASLACLLAVPAFGSVATPVVIFVLGLSPGVGGAVMMTILGFPFCTAIAFGCYSVATAGITLRNLPGVIGCFVPLTIVALFVINEIRDWLR